MEKSLQEQNVGDKSKLFFKIKYFKEPKYILDSRSLDLFFLHVFFISNLIRKKRKKNIDKISDCKKKNKLTKYFVFLLFFQANKAVINNIYYVPENLVVYLAAYQLQATLGDFDSPNIKDLLSEYAKDSQNFHHFVSLYSFFSFHFVCKMYLFCLSASSLRLYIPSEYLRTTAPSHWIKRLTEAHKQLAGMRSDDAKWCYMAIARQMPCFGATFFEVLQGKTLAALGITEYGVLVYEVLHSSLWRE
jgi:hypothetical protein